MGKNYLDHDEKVKYIEGILNQSTDWSWFVSYLEENYEFTESNSWKVIVKKFHETSELYQRFIKIIEIDNVKLSFTNHIFNEICMVSKFFLGKMSKAEVEDNIENNYAKVLFLFVWITKLQNESNSTNFILDMQLFNYHNMYKLINIKTIKENSYAISKYIEKLKLNDFSQALKCLWDNINEIEHSANSDFLEKNKEMIYCCNTFNHNRIELSEIVTWEEKYLRDMLVVNIIDKSLNPATVSSEYTYPDINSWSEDVIKQIKGFFHDEIADFILETISYILYKSEPSETMINKHLEILLESLIQNESSWFESSSFKIFTYLFQDRILQRNSDKRIFKELLKELNKISNLSIIVNLNNSQIPLSKEQNLNLKEYFHIQSNFISKVSNEEELIEFFDNKDVIKETNNNNFQIAIKKFNSHIFNHSFTTPNLFYSYMTFLMGLRKINMYVDKSIVNSEIIRIQQLWSIEYCEKCIGDLHFNGSSFEISDEMVEAYNNNIIENIFSLSKKCILSSDDDYINVMEITSKNTIMFLATRMNLDKIFPYQETNIIDYRKRDIDKLIKENVKEVQSKYGYRFMNKLEEDIYVNEIIKQCGANIDIYAALFHKGKKLYERILSKVDEVDLLKFNEKITLAHLTQLFPVLEIKIRKFATLINIVPFKESESTFIQYKDPSSILRDILKGIHEETGSFNNFEDILFIYFFMYSSSSLNIRNECIHGRNYIAGNSLKSGFKITLFSLYMIISRIDLIENNIKNAKEAN